MSNAFVHKLDDGLSPETIVGRSCTDDADISAFTSQLQFLLTVGGL